MSDNKPRFPIDNSQIAQAVASFQSHGGSVVRCPTPLVGMKAKLDSDRYNEIRDANRQLTE